MEAAVGSTSISPRERRWVTRLTRLLWFRGSGRRGKQRPVPDWLRHEPFVITAPDGARLSARWFPAPAPAGAVVLAHPDRRYAQDWFVMTGWLDFLHGLGLHALTFDFADYGESRGGTSYYHEHLIAAIREGRRRAPGLPLHVVGVSLGAFVAANASREEPIDLLVLESPYPTFRSWYGRGLVASILRGFELLFPVTARRIDARESLRRTRAQRILVVASEDDHVTPVELTDDVAKAGPADRTTYVRLQGHDHLELFVASAAFRKAVGEALAGRTPSRSAAPDAAHPQGSRARRDVYPGPIAG